MGRTRRCERERDRGRQGGLGRLPSFSLSLSLRKAAERGTELWGSEGPPRCSSNQPHPCRAAFPPHRIPTPLQRRPAAAAPRFSRAQVHLRPAAAAPRSRCAPLRPRPAGEAPSCISAPLPLLPSAAAPRCGRAGRGSDFVGYTETSAILVRMPTCNRETLQTTRTMIITFQQCL